MIDIPVKKLFRHQLIAWGLFAQIVRNVQENRNTVQLRISCYEQRLHYPAGL